MKFFDLKILTEALVNNQIDVNQWNNYSKLKLIRFIDYVKVGIDEDFTHSGTQVGGADKAKSRAKGVGSRDTHKDNCMACINDLLTTTGHKVFGKNLSLKTSTVPKIPAAYKAEGEGDFEKEIDFLLSCNEVEANADTSFTLTKPSTAGGRDTSISPTTLFVNKYDKPPVFNKYSLLISYALGTNSLVANVNGSTEAVELKDNADIVNYDESAKYLDPAIDNPETEAKALELIKLILGSTEKSLQGESNGDLRNVLNSFKTTIPADGNIFLSPDEISGFTGILEYFKKSPEERKKGDSLLDTILSRSIEVLKTSGNGIEFAQSNKIKDIILNGNYDLYVGFADETDATHHSTFGVKGRENVYVGYLTNYKGQDKNEVIPVYFVTANESDKAKLQKTKFSRQRVGALKGTADQGYDKLNTDAMVKTMGDGTLVYQLPIEIWRRMEAFNPEEIASTENPQAASNKNTKGFAVFPLDFGSEDVVADKAVGKQVEPTPSVEPEVTTPAAPEVEQPVETKKTRRRAAPRSAPVTTPEAPIEAPVPQAPTPEAPKKSGLDVLNEIKAKYIASEITHKDAVAAALKVRTDYGMKASEDKIKSFLTSTAAPKPKATASTGLDLRAIESNRAIKSLLSATKLTDAAIPSIADIYAKGGVLSNEQIDSLISKGVSRDKLMSVVRSEKKTVAESRMLKFFNLGSILESLQK